MRKTGAFTIFCYQMTPMSQSINMIMVHTDAMHPVVNQNLRLIATRCFTLSSPFFKICPLGLRLPPAARSCKKELILCQCVMFRTRIIPHFVEHCKAYSKIIAIILAFG